MIKISKTLSHQVTNFNKNSPNDFCVTKILTLFEKNFFLSWFTTTLIAIAIFIISSIPAKGGYGSENYLAITYHFLAFFSLAFFLLITTTKGKNKKFIIPSIILSIIYATLDELHQYFIPGRCSSFGDILTDSAGILLATLIYLIILKFRKTKP